MRANITERRIFLRAANFRATYMLLLEASRDKRLDVYAGHLNEFLEACAENDDLKARNRMGEESAQKDQLRKAFENFIGGVKEAA